MFVFGEIGSPARIGQMNQNDAFVFVAARAKEEALAFQRGEHFVHLAFEQARLRDERRRGADTPRIFCAKQNAEHMRFVIRQRGDEALVPKRGGKGEPRGKQAVACGGGIRHADSSFKSSQSELRASS